MKGFIYKITSPSNRIYIGQTVNIERRFVKYKNLLCNKQPKIYNSLIKYGWESHSKEIIGEYDIDILDDMETYWKKYFLSINDNNWDKVLFCYLNDRKGTRKQLSQEHKDKISYKTKKRYLEGSFSNKGKKLTEEHKDKISKSLKIHYENNEAHNKTGLKDKILDLYKSGLKQHQISKLLKCDPGYVSNVVNKKNK